MFSRFLVLDRMSAVWAPVAWITMLLIHSSARQGPCPSDQEPGLPPVGCMRYSKILGYAFVATSVLAGCATVRQADLDAWVGVPVEALDTHPVFLTMPMYRTQTSAGVEIRNYFNSKELEQCFATSSDRRHVSHSVFVSCSQNRLTCNNLFYIQDGKVTRYAPTGNCYTDNSVRPQPGYRPAT